MSADDNPTEDDIQSEAELKEALDYLLSETEPPPSSEEVTDQVMKILMDKGMLNKNMSSEEVKEVKNNMMEFLKKLKMSRGGSRTRSRSKKSRTRRRKRSSKKKRSTRRRR
jgi:hypothetical protein